MPTALETILSIPELLEAILLYLPPRAILHAQRVNHTFHSLITISPSLQRALFFRPDPPAPSRLTTWSQNPLLTHSFPPIFHLQSPTLHYFTKLKHADTFGRLPWNASDETKAAYAHPDASWRRMLVTQPPVTELVIKGRLVTMAGDSKRRGKLAVRGRTLGSRNVKGGGDARRDLGEDGLTMGVLYDVIEGAVLGEGDDFWLEWDGFPDSGGEGKGVDGEFCPRASVTLCLRHTVSCMLRKYASPSRLKSDAAEEVDVGYSEWKRCSG